MFLLDMRSPHIHIYPPHISILSLAGTVSNCQGEAEGLPVCRTANSRR